MVVHDDDQISIDRFPKFLEWAVLGPLRRPIY